MATEIAFAKQFLAQLDTKPSKIGPDHVEDARNYPGGNPFLIPKYPSSPVLPKRRAGGARSSQHPSSSSPSSSSASGQQTQQQDSGVTVSAVSSRNPPLNLKFSSLPAATTSLLDIKQLIHTETGCPIAKIKLLYNKKPVSDTKVLKELGTAGAGSGEVELGVMVLGGAASLPADYTPPVRREPSLDQKNVQEEGQKVQEGGKEEAVIKQEDDKMDVEETRAVAAPVVAPGEISGEEVLKTEEFWSDLRGFLEQRTKDEKVAKELVEKWRGGGL
ncbi:cell-cycle control medial ring component [Cladorrhinum sp. PSN259]|nr:cell-cycle control medial ring component [Cladorrhinum sp. PSN259]